jgi:hypothetical protein
MLRYSNYLRRLLTLFLLMSACHGVAPRSAWAEVNALQNCGPGTDNPHCIQSSCLPEPDKFGEKRIFHYLEAWRGELEQWVEKHSHWTHTTSMVAVLRPESGQIFTKPGEIPQINFDLRDDQGGIDGRPCLERVRTVSSHPGPGVPHGPGGNLNVIALLSVSENGNCSLKVATAILSRINSFRWPDGSPMYGPGSPDPAVTVRPRDLIDGKLAVFDKDI